MKVRHVAQQEIRLAGMAGALLLPQYRCHLFAGDVPTHDERSEFPIGLEYVLPNHLFLDHDERSALRVTWLRPFPPLGAPDAKSIA
jgi:hypothetical protein